MWKQKLTSGRALGTSQGSITKAESWNYMKYFHKVTKWYGIRPFSQKQSHLVTELNHYLLHLSWDEEPEETREYHDSKTIAVLYPSIVLFMIADKLSLPEEAALSRMTTPDTIYINVHIQGIVSHDYL